MDPISNFVDDAPPNLLLELEQRFEELNALQKDQTQMGTSVPQLYGSLGKFVANPSTVSVETYKRMLDTDETIGAGIDFMNLAMIARFGDYTHPDPKIQQFVRRALGGMDVGWTTALDEMFSAEWAGFSNTEMIWKFEDDFDGAPAWVPKKLVTYAPLTMVFAVDRHGDLLPDGIFQYQRYHNAFFTGRGFGNLGGDLNGFRPDMYASVGDVPYPIRVAADLTFLTVKIPTSKVIHLRSSSTGKFNNPYGRSILRRVYKNWVLKDAFLKMWIVAADKKGTPLVIGYAAPNDTVFSQLQGENQPGNGMTDASKRPMRADQAMGAAFKNMHNSSYLVFPGKKGETYDVEAIQQQGDMNIFKDGIDYFNRAIMRGLLIPPLVLGGDGGGSFSLGQEHHKIFKQAVDGKLAPYKTGILKQFITPLIAHNFPRAQWEKHGPGEFKLEEYDPETMEKLANIFASLTTSGYMNPEDQVDMDHVRHKVGGMLKKEAAPAPEPMLPFGGQPGGDEGEPAENLNQPEKKEGGEDEDESVPNYSV